jgi:NAD(P)H-dependent FMN reductase
VFVTGEYNWGIQAGLKNLTDHFLEEWFWRPAAVVSYSAGRFAGVRAATAWHGILSEMGMVVVFQHVCRWSHWTDLIGRSRTHWHGRPGD